MRRKRGAERTDVTILARFGMCFSVSPFLMMREKREADRSVVLVSISLLWNKKLSKYLLGIKTASKQRIIDMETKANLISLSLTGRHAIPPGIAVSNRGADRMQEENLQQGFSGPTHLICSL